MASLGTLTLDLIAKIGGFEQGLDQASRVSKRKAKEIADAQKKAAKDVEKSWEGVGAAIKAGIAGITISATIGKFIQETVNAQNEQAQLAAVIKSTGQAAGYSIEQLNKMATQMSGASMFSEGDINQAQARLLSYTNVVGEQFPQAMQAAIDMAARLGMPIAQAAEQIGKALDVPSQGLTALTKQGFRFTDEQKKLIESLENTGRTAEAQKIILDALESAYGGAAKASRDTFGGALAALKNQLNLLMIGDDGSFGGAKDAVNELTATLGSPETKQAFASIAESIAGLITLLASASTEFVNFGKFVGETLAKDLHGSADPIERIDEQIAQLKSRIESFGNEASFKDRFLFGLGTEDIKRELGAMNNQMAALLATRAQLVNAANSSGSRPAPAAAVVLPKPVRIAHAPDASIAQIAAARLAADLSAIKAASEAITNAYANAEKIMSAQRAAGLLDEKQYYAAKLAFLNLNSDEQERALQKEIARLQAEKLTGKEAIDNAKKIAEAQAKLAKVREDAAANAEVLAIQESAAYKKIESAVMSARQAAQDYFDTVNHGYAAQLAGIGMGVRNRDFQAALSQIEERYQSQRRDLQNQRALAEMQGTFGPEAERQYNEQLAIINEFQQKALASYQDYYAAITQAQSDWKNGASEAMRNYFDESRDVANQTEQLFTNAFKGMEDAFVSFVKTGKLDFKSLADSIIADLIRIQVKSMIANLGGGGGGGFFSMITGALFGSFGVGGAGLGGASRGSYGISGGRAFGGPVLPNSLYRVNERGPEIFESGGSQYLMTGKDGGTVIPSGGHGGDMKLTIVNNTTGRIDHVQERRISPTERALIISEAVQATSAQFSDPNSKMSKTFGRNYSSQRVR